MTQSLEYMLFHNDRLLSFAYVQADVQEWESWLISAGYFYEVLAPSALLIVNIRLDDLVRILFEKGHPTFSYGIRRDETIWVQHWYWGMQLRHLSAIREGYAATDRGDEYDDECYDWQDSIAGDAFRFAFSEEQIMSSFDAIFRKMQERQGSKGYSDETLHKLLKESMDGSITPKYRYYARKTLY